MKKKKPTENCKSLMLALESQQRLLTTLDHSGRAYESASEVHAGCPSIGIVQPLRLLETEEAVV